MNRDHILTFNANNLLHYYATFLSLLMLVLCGCSKQKHFSQLLSAADHVAATNRNGQVFGCIVSGAEVSNLAKAVASAKRPYGLKALDFTRDPFNWDLEFYAGTNSLAVMHLLGNGFFNLEGVQYCDGTGVAEAFWKKLEADRMR
jgi:hypothetical protein